jgi:SpoVK/Ycf46/Vps4 family AAA+-type ATPase
MRLLTNDQSVTVSYKDTEFRQLIAQLRQEGVIRQATMITFGGIPKEGMEPIAKEVANQFGKTLYRVDLNAIVSKYIGETEKNLSRLFQRAEVSNWILYFDEADALFGKRDSVKDASDRFENLSTDYFLETIERHRVLILALFRSKTEAERKRRRMRQLVIKYP